MPFQKKIHHLFLLSLLILTAQHLFASKADSLELLIMQTSQDTHRVTLLNELGRVQKIENPQKSLQSLGEAATLAEELGFAHGEARARLYIGQVFTHIGEYDTARKSLDIALKRFDQAKDVNSIGKTWNSIGVLEYYQNNFNKAESAYQTALEHFTDPFNVAATYNNLALMNKLAGDSEGYVDYQLKALREFEKLEDKSMELYCLGNLSIFHLEMGDIEKAKEYNQEGYKRIEGEKEKEQRVFLGQQKGQILIREEKSDSALAVLQESRALAKETGLLREEATILLNLGGIYFQKGQTDLAKDRFQQSNQIFAQLGDLRGQASTLTNLGNLNLEQGAIDTAVNELQSALGMALQLGHPPTLAKIYDHLAAAYEKMGDAEAALHYRTRYNDLQKDLNDPQQWRKILQMENDYHLEKQEETLKRMEEAKNTAESRTKWLLAGIFVLVVLVIAGFAFWFRNLNKNNKPQPSPIETGNFDLKIAYAQAQGRIEELRHQLKEKEAELAKMQKKPEQKATNLPEYFDTLTSREIEVFLCLGAGLSDKAIADELSVSLSTVRTHTRNVYSKLNLKGRQEVVKMAYQYGLIRN